MLTGKKTYIGVIVSLIGMTRFAEFISADQVEIVVTNIAKIIDLTIQVVGIIIVVLGAVHKDIRLKKPT